MFALHKYTQANYSHVLEHRMSNSPTWTIWVQVDLGHGWKWANRYLRPRVTRRCLSPRIRISNCWLSMRLLS